MYPARSFEDRIEVRIAKKIAFDVILKGISVHGNIHFDFLIFPSLLS